MDNVRGYLLGPPHGTTPAAVMANKTLKLDPLLTALKVSVLFLFGSSENVQRAVV